jgi:hypothetical protein
MLVRTREYRHHTEVPHHKYWMIESSVIDLDHVSRLSCLHVCVFTFTNESV